MVITAKTKLKELDEMPEFRDIRGSLVHGWTEEFKGEKGERTLLDLQKEHPTWNADDVVFGLRNLKRVAEKGVYFFPLSEKSNLVRLPSEHRRRDAYFLLCAGGAYGSVCTMIESLPVAARLNELGFDCFCLNYHVAEEKSFLHGLLPDALRDVSDALAFIRDNRGRFRLNPENYYLTGFSAGGHLAAVFSLEHILSGYQAPTPKGLFLVYPLISLEMIEPEPVKNYFLTGLFGAEDKELTAAYYEVPRNMTSSYPQTFYVYCRDDDAVSPVNAEIMENSLSRCRVRHDIECFERGGHGFGLGSVLPGSSYIDRAVAFLLGEEKTDGR